MKETNVAADEAKPAETRQEKTDRQKNTKPLLANDTFRLKSIISQ